MPMTLKELAERIGASLEGDGDATVSRCAPIDRAGPGDLAFLANARYARYLPETKAGAVLTDAAAVCPPGVNRLIADDPYFAFCNAMVALCGYRRHPRPSEPLADAPGRVISALAVVHREARIGEGTVIHPHAVIEAGARVGCNCMIYPGVYVGPDSHIGDECVLHPNVSVYEQCVLGNRVVVHSSTVIGQDGFGYATHGGEHHKIPQAGIVVIEDDVELGAGCAIERAAMGETRIGRGTKFADLISIGHGTRIGAHCLFVSLVGISGSVDVGDHVALGGQVGVAGHLKIGDGVQAMARSAIVRDVEPGIKIGGVPAVPADLARRNALASLELHEMSKRLRQVERKMEALKERAAEAP